MGERRLSRLQNTRRSPLSLSEQFAGGWARFLDVRNEDGTSAAPAILLRTGPGAYARFLPSLKHPKLTDQT